MLCRSLSIKRDTDIAPGFTLGAGSSPVGDPGFNLHRTYASDPDRPIDLCTEVRDGDVALVPHGYHGPCVAAPGYDMYYLNVMAGPDEDLAWLACWRSAAVHCRKHRRSCRRFLRR